MSIFLRFLLLFFIAFSGAYIGPSEALSEEAEGSFSPLKPMGNRYVKTSLVFDRETLVPGLESTESLGQIGVLFKIEPGWHIYWKNSGEAAIPTTIKWSVPSGWRVSELKWPLPLKFKERGDITTIGYSKEVLLFADILAPAEVPSSDIDSKFKAEVEWLVCKDICVPGSAELSKSIKFSSSQPLAPSNHTNVFKKYAASVPLKNNSQLKAVTNWPSFLAGKDYFVGLEFSEPLKSDSVQFYPHLDEKASAINASLTELENGNSLIFFPLEISKSASPGKKNFHFTLGFKDKDSQTYNFAYQVGKSEPAKTDQLTKLVKQDVERLNFNWVDVSEKSKKAPLSFIPSPPKNDFSLPVILLLGFLAGIVLNLMPCVLPVLSIKVISLIKKAGDCPTRRTKSCIAYISGVLFSFIALATAIVMLREAGQYVGWGFQFQSPTFVLVLTLVVYTLALSFFDLFTISLPGATDACEKVDSMQNSFWKQALDGVLTTALATPCTAPFLGTVLAFAFASSAALIYTVFIAIGLGLATPFVVFALSPKLMSLLPKPGNWMYSFKQFLGFLLLGTVVWLLFVLHGLTGVGAIWALGLLLLITFSIWIYSKLQSKRLIVGTLLLLLCLGTTANYWSELTTISDEKSVFKSKLIPWQAYSEELVDSARANKQAVFIDFTADWCVTCKANEKLVIETIQVAEAIKSKNVLPLIADWTKGSDHITKALNKYGGNAVPHYVVISKEGDVVVLPPILTKDTLVNSF